MSHDSRVPVQYPVPYNLSVSRRFVGCSVFKRVFRLHPVLL
jgi:hypothetical protein